MAKTPNRCIVLMKSRNSSLILLLSTAWIIRSLGPVRNASLDLYDPQEAFQTECTRPFQENGADL